MELLERFSSPGQSTSRFEPKKRRIESEFSAAESESNAAESGNLVVIEVRNTSYKGEPTVTMDIITEKEDKDSILQIFASFAPYDNTRHLALDLFTNYS